MMRGYRRSLVGLLFIALLTLGANALLAQAAAAKSDQPSEVVDAFYRWYIKALVQGRDPMKQDKVTLRKFVATSLLDEIDRRMKSPDGLDADYFLQAQDYQDEWKNNVAVARPETNGAIATTLVTLTAKGSKPYRLKVTLKKDPASWKISKVQAVRS